MKHLKLAAARVLVGLVVAALLVLATACRRSSREPSHPEPTRNPIAFDLSTCLVDADLLVDIGVEPDAVPPLDEPRTIDRTGVERLNRQGRGKLLVPRDRVVGVRMGGEARAYPLRLLRWHEVVNDTVGNQPLLVTYCPLADSVVVFDRREPRNAAEVQAAREKLARLRRRTMETELTLEIERGRDALRDKQLEVVPDPGSG